MKNNVKITQSILTICPICKEQIQMKLDAKLYLDEDIVITQSQLNFGAVHKKCNKEVKKRNAPDYMG